jgi:hypothetical protein
MMTRQVDLSLEFPLTKYFASSGIRSLYLTPQCHHNLEFKLKLSPSLFLSLVHVANISPVNNQDVLGYGSYGRREYRRGNPD